MEGKLNILTTLLLSILISEKKAPINKSQKSIRYTYFSDTQWILIESCEMNLSWT